LIVSLHSATVIFSMGAIGPSVAALKITKLNCSIGRLSRIFFRPSSMLISAAMVVISAGNFS